MSTCYSFQVWIYSQIAFLERLFRSVLPPTVFESAKYSAFPLALYIYQFSVMISELAALDWTHVYRISATLLSLQLTFAYLPALDIKALHKSLSYDTPAHVSKPRPHHYPNICSLTGPGASEWALDISHGRRTQTGGLCWPWDQVGGHLDREL